MYPWQGFSICAFQRLSCPHHDLFVMPTHEENETVWSAAVLLNVFHILQNIKFFAKCSSRQKIRLFQYSQAVSSVLAPHGGVWSLGADVTQCNLCRVHSQIVRVPHIHNHIAHWHLRSASSKLARWHHSLAYYWPRLSGPSVSPGSVPMRCVWRNWCPGAAPETVCDRGNVNGWQLRILYQISNIGQTKPFIRNQRSDTGSSSPRLTGHHVSRSRHIKRKCGTLFILRICASFLLLDNLHEDVLRLDQKMHQRRRPGVTVSGVSWKFHWVCLPSLKLYFYLL